MPTRENDGRLGLKVDGKDDLSEFIQRITYTEAIGELDGMTATCRIRASQLSSVKALLEPGLKFVLTTFAGSSKSVEREGDIIAVTYEQSGQDYTVILVGVNYLHRLRASSVTEVWKKSHSAIVKAIAGRASPKLTAKVQGVNTTADFTFQQNETDAVFLMRLAREHNYICRVVGKELHFARPDTASGSLKINFADDVKSIRMTANLKDYINEVTVYWGDPEDSKGLKITKNKQTVSSAKMKVYNAKSKLGPSLGENAFRVTKKLVIGGYDSPLYNKQTQAEAKAKSELTAAAMSFIEGVAVCSGCPAAECGVVLEIEGALWPFNGSFYISKVFHEYTVGGMVTEITFKANSLPAS